MWRLPILLGTSLLTQTAALFQQPHFCNINSQQQTFTGKSSARMLIKTQGQNSKIDSSDENTDENAKIQTAFTNEKINANIRQKNEPQRNPRLEKPRIPVLQYHSNWVCVNKPAQMTVHRSKESSRRRDFVVASLLKRQLRRKIYPVHRLDHRTSGCLLFAFDPETCAQLHASLTDKTNAVKEYVALLRGGWRDLPETVIVDQSVNVDGIAREAKTKFQLLATLETPHANEDQLEYKGACSLVLCRPQTGRTHQIRRHAYAIGHPILGDSEHGDSRVNRWWRKNRNLDRLFLHCLSLDLPAIQTVAIDTEKNNEFNDNRIRCTAPLFDELSYVLKHPELKTLWEVAARNDPRLKLEPYDEKGGTLGPGAIKRRKAEMERQKDQARETNAQHVD